MPRRILVDTVFVIALVNRRDQHHRQAIEWAKRLVDCISFSVMSQAGLHEALSYDQHFAQAGFEPLMRSAGD